MALGGGTYTTQNKILPGAYLNFVSAARAGAAVSDRGIAALPLALDWGPEGEVIELTKEAFQKDSLCLLGYPYTAPQMLPLREVFRGAVKVLCCRLNTGTKKAQNAYATAKYGGTRGNVLTIKIQNSVELEEGFTVTTLLDGTAVDVQEAESASALQPNAFVDWNPDAVLQAEAGVPLTGGSDGAARTGESYQAFLAKIEGCRFHALGCDSAEKTIVDLFVAFTRRMRDEVGVKFQTAVWRAEHADYEGVVSVKNSAGHTGASLAAAGEAVVGQTSLGAGDEGPALIPWVTGILAGCAVNQSNTNRLYDGEYAVDTGCTQAELEQALQNGEFVLHRVDDQVRVLDDVNTLVTVSAEKSADFQSNQTIRVLDQIAADIASLFVTKYLGQMPNDSAGRTSLWSDIVSHHQSLQTIRAIEGFSAENVKVEQGQSKKAVVVQDSVTPVNSMAQLYMEVVVN